MPHTASDARRRPAPTAPVPAPSAAAPAVLPILSLLPLLAACGAGDAGDPGGAGGAGPAAERIDSAGVEIVRNAGGDRPFPFALEPVRRLGGADEGPEAFYSLGRTMVAVDGGGDVYVLDGSAHRVVVFDSAGTHLRTMGARGDGPGEMQFPIWIDVEADGTAHVLDVSKRSLVRFSPDGQASQGADLPPGFFGGSIRRRERGFLLERSGDDGVERLLEIIDGDTTELASARPGTGEPVVLEGCGLRLAGLSPVFAPDLRWDERDRRVAWVSGDAYAVEVRTDPPDGAAGRAARSIRRPLPPRQATPEAALEELGEGIRIGGGGSERVCEAGELLEVRGVAPTVPTVRRLVLPPDGGVWVERWEPGDEVGPVDVFAPDGAYRGTLSAGTPFPVAFLPDGRPLWIETDELDVDRLVVGRLAPPG